MLSWLVGMFKRDLRPQDVSCVVLAARDGRVVLEIPQVQLEITIDPAIARDLAEKLARLADEIEYRPRAPEED